MVQDPSTSHWLVQIQVMSPTWNTCFCHARSFNQPLVGWDTSHVTDMDEIFWGAKSLNQPSPPWTACFIVQNPSTNHWMDGTTSHVTDMWRRFWGCKILQPITGWMGYKSSYQHRIHVWQTQVALFINGVFPMLQIFIIFLGKVVHMMLLRFRTPYEPNRSIPLRTPIPSQFRSTQHT